MGSFVAEAIKIVVSSKNRGECMAICSHFHTKKTILIEVLKGRENCNRLFVILARP